MSRRRRKVALVTGAGRGIGRATAEAFVDAGFAVVIAERVAARGRSAARTLRQRGAEALFVQADVGKRGNAERAVRMTLRRFGSLDVVVNNAGVIEVGRLEQIARRDVEEIVRVNLLGPLFVARAALPTMRRRHRGAIINVSSLLGKEGEGEYVTYCATKFGVIGMTEALADELRGTGVKAWAVCPTLVNTPLARKSGADMKDAIPPEHVARAIVALATNRRRRPSGAAIDVTS